MGFFKPKTTSGKPNSDGLKALRQAGREGGWLQGMDDELNGNEWNVYFQKTGMRFMIAYAKSGVVLHMLLVTGKEGSWEDAKETRSVSEGVKILKNPKKYCN